MSRLEVFQISYRNRNYNAAIIPNVFTDNNERIIIGCHSLDSALFDVEKGYPDNEAQYIDESIYAFLDDEYFILSCEEFVKIAKKYLD